MASTFRNLIASRSRQVLSTLGNVDVPEHRQLVSQMKLVQNPTTSPFPICVKVPISSLGIGQDFSLVSRFIETFETDSTIPAVSQDLNQDMVIFSPERDSFISREISNQLKRDRQGYEWYRDGIFPDENPLNVVVEFSSPNVAKPFHVGHLRSTIIGHFVANIHEIVGHNVTRINYLGDFGTQFGFLALGLRASGLNIEEVINFDDTETSIRKLYEIYVAANRMSEKDPKTGDEAKALFASLEQGDAALTKQWKLIRDLTVAELSKVYKRLGVTFDHYHGESMYGKKKSQEILQLLTEKGLVSSLDDGRKVVNARGNKVVVTKSDGSSLYMTRDFAAAIDRREAFSADKIFYVVETGQSLHLENLFDLLAQCGFEWAKNMRHVNFGRIQGMSTRKGTAVFLSDILNEGRDRMLERLSETTNTKVDTVDERLFVSDRLATTAVIVSDFRQRRIKNYKFSWEQTLHTKGDSGIKLQYTHARLTSLLAKNDWISHEMETEMRNNSTAASHLREPEALNVLFQISRFGEVLRDSYIHLEPCFLVNYLFQLCNQTSKALKTLPVRGESHELAFARKSLFAASRAVLRQGMRAIGIQPLDKM